MHPAIEHWFAASYGVPTPVQAEVWPAVAAGQNVLALAPTGSGKTFAAFLVAIDRLVRGEWSGSGVKVLYVSPLRALNNDVRRNLEAPLASLEEWFSRHEPGTPFPDIRVLARSGDSTQRERAEIVRHPPDILVTTPESLSLMLCSVSGAAVLTGVRLVVVDEIHALAGGKRGTQLVAALEQLTLTAGEFQRVGLSATVDPPGAVAAWLGGWHRGLDGVWARRPVRVVDAAGERGLELEVTAIPRADGGAGEGGGPEAWWAALADRLVADILAHRSTLVFANSRRQTERLARIINDAAGTTLAYAHHGSLSREIRHEVEARLKAGELRAIVATASLELGIDVGSVDRVILVETPLSVSAALQRVGRAGHQVGGTSRARLIPLHGMDLVSAAACSRLFGERRHEPVRPVRLPLDYLAQFLVGLLVVREWRLDELYQLVRQAEPWHELPRPAFDAVIAMLAGDRSDLPIRELKARIDLDPVAGTARARPGVEFILRQGGGTIPDRGMYQLRQAADQALLGELDEEFVWERNVGDTFTLGTAAWRIARITPRVVEVVAADPGRLMVPFWKAEDHSRDAHLADAVGEFLAAADDHLRAGDCAAWIGREYGFGTAEAASLADFLRRQREATGLPLPSARTIIVELVPLGGNAATPAGWQCVIHTMAGGRANKPLGMALAGAWAERRGRKPEVYAGNDSILLQVPIEDADDFDPAAFLRSLAAGSDFERHVRAALVDSGLFGARFRENATRALLLPRGDARRRVPLWLTRLRARQLREAVAGRPGFPIEIETWRECLEDEFDLPRLRRLLDGVASGEVAVEVCAPEAPSPFAADLVRRQTNDVMYRGDETALSGASAGGGLVEALLDGGASRPAVPALLAARFESKLLGTWHEYRPRTPGELASLLADQGFVPATVWDELCRHSGQISDGLDAFQDELSRLSSLFARFRPPGALSDWIVAIPQLPGILRGLGLDPANPPAELPQPVRAWLAEIPRSSAAAADPGAASRALLGRWLARQGPVSPTRLSELFGWQADRMAAVLEDLVQDGRAVAGRLIAETDETLYCDAENYERLLRLHRNERRYAAAALPAVGLPLFLALWHGLLPDDGDDPKSAATPESALQDAIDRCAGLPLPAALWESAVLPLRVPGWRADLLDGLFRRYRLAWTGAGPGRVRFAFPDELAAAAADRLPEPGAEPSPVAAALLGQLRRRPPESGATLSELARDAALDPREAAAAMWELAWDGAVWCDGMDVLRAGIAADFKPEAPPPARGRGRWEPARPTGGRWHIVEPTLPASPLERLEADRARVAQLVRRHGVLHRGVFAHEDPGAGWQALFPAMRLMELSGELLGGLFIEGLPGPQFAGPEAVAVLRAAQVRLHAPESPPVWWCNACDPASPLGLAAPAPASEAGDGPSSSETPGSPAAPVPASLAPLPPPKRLPGSWLVYRGAALAMVVRRQGREADLALPPGHPDLPAVLAFFRFLVGQGGPDATRITLEALNGQPPERSPWKDDLARAGFTGPHLWRSW